MLRLRAVISRGLGHRWLGPALMVLLVVLVALVLLHMSLDHFVEAGVACLASLAALLTIVPPVRPRPRAGTPVTASERGPPRLLPLSATATTAPFDASSPPLRL